MTDDEDDVARCSAVAAVERDVAPVRSVERFWEGAWGPRLPVLQDREFAGLVDHMEQEGREHLRSLLVLFQRAVDSDCEIQAASRRLAGAVNDLGWHGPGSTGEAHQVAVDLDWLSTQPAGAWTHPSEALGPEASSTRDLLTLARARHEKGQCPAWVVAKLKTAIRDD